MFSDPKKYLFILNPNDILYEADSNKYEDVSLTCDNTILNYLTKLGNSFQSKKAIKKTINFMSKKL